MPILSDASSLPRPCSEQLKEGVAVDPDKIARIRDWPVPSTVAERRSFLGLASYYQEKLILFTSKHALKSHPNVAVTVGEQPNPFHRNIHP